MLVLVLVLVLQHWPLLQQPSQNLPSQAVLVLVLVLAVVQKTVLTLLPRQLHQLLLPPLRRTTPRKMQMFIL